MSISMRSRLTAEELKQLMVMRPGLTLAKLALFVAMMAALMAVAWNSSSPWVDWPAYVALGYLWMGIFTFMHEATHDALFPKKWQNWAFGIVSMIPIPVSFVTFRLDHLRHHRNNRSPLDPDAFTMGKRGIADFVVFYLYLTVGAVLTVLHFAIIYPIKAFGPKNWAIHLFEVALKALFALAVVHWAQGAGLLGPILKVWLWPLLFFSTFNSIRFIAEHYETPWNQGNLVGSRTITSNPVHGFFWNNVNWHIGHHVYPRVPWHNLVELHRRIEPDIHALGAIVDTGYSKVIWNALRRGPESEQRCAAFLEAQGPSNRRTNVPSPVAS